MPGFRSCSLPPNLLTFACLNNAIVKKFLGILFLFSLLLLACEGEQHQLVGTWNGLGLYENGDSVAVDPGLIKLAVTENDRYQFQSTLGYSEAGTYRVKGGFFYTTDTTRQPAVEKAVRIEQLTVDSLGLLMEREGTPQLLWLQRVAE